MHRLVRAVHILASDGCAADADLDGAVTPGDVTTFANAFVAGRALADVDHDRAVTSSDAAALMAAYGCRGCQSP